MQGVPVEEVVKVCRRVEVMRMKMRMRMKKWKVGEWEWEREERRMVRRGGRGRR